MNEYNAYMGKKIGIYKELAVVIVTAFTIAVLASLGVFMVCSHYGILVDVVEDYSDYKRRYDIQVMRISRMNSLISNAIIIKMLHDIYLTARRPGILRFFKRFQPDGRPCPGGTPQLCFYL